MDLHEQAEQAVNVLRDQTGVILSDASRSLATMCWLDGYKAGMVAVQGMANEAFSRVAEELS